jgi:sugar phosphate isomerase/epimerase
MKIGAQLYTVREFARTLEEFARTLQKIAAIGYTSVQVSGTCAYEPQWLAEQLAKNGLTCDLTHIGMDRLVRETDRVVAEHKVFGCRYIGIGSMPGVFETGLAAYQPYREAITPAVRRIRELGGKFMYHNHAREFEIGDGKNLMQQMMEDFAPSEYGFILDTYWVKAGGGDPVEWLKKLRGRIECIHLKDMTASAEGKTRFAPVGYGRLDFDAILAAASEGGTEYAFVEQDDCYGENPFDCLDKSYRFLAAKGLK